MLKERIEFLCKKKNISRKELVEGLVTQAHLANILAERYPLPPDLAEHMALRLGVAPSYLLQVSTADEAVLERAEHIFGELSQPAGSVPESAVNDLADKDDALTIELTTALMKAVYYQQMNDTAAYDYLHTSYLNDYLEKFGRPDEVAAPLPLQKALLYYKIHYFRSKSRYYEVMNHVERLRERVQAGSEIWLTVQNIKMEACVYLKQFEQAKTVFEHTMRHVYDDRLFHRLAGLYVAHSGFCFAMGLVQEALLALSMAEANLVYAMNQGDVMTSIMNNRIIILTMTGELEKASEEIGRFEAMVEREASEIRQLMLPVTLIYRCEVASARKDWAVLAQNVEQLEAASTTEDQHMALVYYLSQLALSRGDQPAFLGYAMECLPYFESASHMARLEQLYEALAIVSEDSRRYKESSYYYHKLVEVLRNNSATRV
ncbi:helix-turn-helix domain-containing protein [Paenibacillus nasutitermitis]|uniref:helix-turn-helix domain-containing protein n=1 Tax=Paenibacillus nasutitermitis TaxID=1652958 RepID=UPI001667FF7C|nr:helix-turn-helix transcriptional regulator [Paenibacillus nasutitermitis]